MYHNVYVGCNFTANVSCLAVDFMATISQPMYHVNHLVAVVKMLFTGCFYDHYFRTSVLCWSFFTAKVLNLPFYSHYFLNKFVMFAIFTAALFTTNIY